MPFASTTRLNELWHDVSSGHYESFILLEKDIELPAPFYEEVFEILHQKWGRTHIKFYEEQCASRLAQRQDFPLNLHERLFAQRQDKFHRIALIASRHITQEQLNVLFDELISFGEFEHKKSPYKHTKVFLQSIVSDQFDKNLTKKIMLQTLDEFTEKKSVEPPYIVDYPEYMNKVLMFFNEKELVDAIEKCPQWLKSKHFLSLLAKRTVSVECANQIFEYAKSINIDSVSISFDFIELSLSKNAEEIDQILNKRLNKNALMIAANNPFARKETLEDKAKKICKRILFDQESSNLIKDIFTEIPIHETVCKLIFGILDEVDDRNEEQYYESLYEITYELFETAPLDTAIPLAKKWANTFYPFMGKQIISPYLMRRGVEDEELWDIFLRENTSIFNQGNQWIEFWRSVPDKFFPLVPVRELGMEPLLGIYSREDPSDEFRQALFDELTRRINLGTSLKEKWNRVLNECIPYILAFNKKIPLQQAQKLKSFFFERFGEEIETFIPSPYFNQSDLIEKLVLFKEPKNGTTQKDLFMSILERGNLSNQIKALFDEPPRWGSIPQRKNENDKTIG